MHTTLNPSRHTEDALKQLVGLRWPHVCVVARVCASLCKQTAPGPRALAVRTHSVLTVVPQRTWQLGGASEDASRRIIVVPRKKAPFLNTGNTRLAPWSGMHAWFIYTLQMVGRLCVSLYIYMYVCMFIFTYVAPEESSLSTQTLVRMLLLSSFTAMVPGRSFDLLFPLSWRCSVCTDCRSLGSPVSTTWPKNSSLIKLWFQICGNKTGMRAAPSGMQPPFMS